MFDGDCADGACAQITVEESDGSMLGIRRVKVTTMTCCVCEGVTRRCVALSCIQIRCVRGRVTRGCDVSVGYTGIAWITSRCSIIRNSSTSRLLAGRRYHVAAAVSMCRILTVSSLCLYCNVPQRRLHFKSLSIISNKLHLIVICYW